MLRALPLQIVGLFVILSLITSCVPYRDLVSFSDASLPKGTPEAILNAPPLLVQQNDLLRITVTSADPLASAPFNTDDAGQGSGGQVQRPVQPETLELYSGYFVDQDGFIDFPVLGRVEVLGKTLEEIKGYLRTEIRKYLKDPVVNVRFINFKVTVLGSVTAPGVIRLSNPRVTLLEALGQAGDLTDYADRSDVLVVREEDGKRTYEYLDLHTDEIFTSPYYYLKQNDLIYVRPIKARTAAVASRGQRVLGASTAVIALVAVLNLLNNTRD